MEAGRELDALVAEKVMGWKYRGYGNGGGEWTFNGQKMAFGGFNGGSLPRYSTNIAAAWEVVNHLMCLGYDNKWFFQLHYDNVELWDASFYKESTSDGGGPEVWSTAGAPALAICLAALKANGVTHE